MSGEVDKWSVEQCRDWLAREAGTVTDDRGMRFLDADDMHPFPATLDAAASAMPDEFCSFQMRVMECASDGSVEGHPNGRYWSVSLREFGAEREVREARDPVSVHVIHQGTKAEAIMLAMLRYAVKARMAGGGGAVKA